MHEIKITVQAPEIAGALSSLAMAVRGSQAAANLTGAAEMPPAANPALPGTGPMAPAGQTGAQCAPAVPQAAPPPAVPTAPPPGFTREQIMAAGAALIDAGKINELLALLNSFGVQAVTQLDQEHLGAFATELRKLGAQI